MFSGSRGTRTHKRREAATCFQDRLLIRPDDFRIGSSSGGWNRTNGLLVQSQASLPAATTPKSIAYSTRAQLRRARGEGLEPPRPGSKPGGLPLADPRLECALRESNSPIQLGRLAPLPLGQEHIEGGRRGSRTLKAHRSPVFETGAIAHWLALPLKLRRPESNRRRGA